MSARISVVVPIYNVAPYLEECLESLAEQTATDLEVVMVDDGSTDESPEIAARFATRDARFRLVHQPNAGLGAARNTGSEHATGEFIAFVDSDDVVPRHAYEVLVGALDRSGSDFATGNARRLTSLGTVPAAFLGNVFKRTRLGTHITHYPALLVDRTAWNKLFRRSFWDRHAFRFPEGVLYEDIPVTLPAHYLARAVDVVDHTIYLWRMREGGDLSITQRRTETRALRDRVSAVDHVSRFLAAQGLVASKWRYDRTVVGHDLRYFLDVLPVADAEYHALFLELVNDFLDRADPAALDQPLAIDRLKWHLVRRRALPELLEVLRFQAEEREETPAVRVGRRWYGDYPYRGDARLAIPDGVFRLKDELSLVARVDELSWEEGTLRIEGYAYIDAIGAPERESQRVSLWARRTDSLVRRARLTTERTHRPDVTANAAQQFASLDWSGFVATLDGAHLRRRGRWREGTWEVGIGVRAGGVVRRSSSFDPAPLHAAPVAGFEAEDGTSVQAGVAATGELTVTVRRRPPVARSATVENGVLQLEGELGPLGATKPSLVLERRGGAARLRYPVHVDRSRKPASFLARVPLGDLVGEVDVADRAARAEEAEGVAWDVQLGGRAGRAALALDEGVREASHREAGREIVVGRTRFGQLSVTERSFRPVITSAAWSPEGTLRLSGGFAAPAGQYELVLALRGGGEEHALPFAHHAEARRFDGELTPAALPSPTGPRPLAQGAWELLLRSSGGVEVAASLVLDADVVDRLPLAARVGHKRFH
ncbi:MAG: glycosyltransferase, partial [Actinobacteria bacterium]|nr:glycosyltransferase [Actinomycetota bacterium]